MKAVELAGDIDAQHRLKAQVTPEPAGRSGSRHRLGTRRTRALNGRRGVATEWADELADSRQDIYTLDDGQPINTAG